VSKTIAALMVSLLGLAGYQLSDTAAVEIAGLVLQVGGLLVAWGVRASRGDVNALGVRKGRPPGPS
jgi:hypothetical protein